MSAARFILTGQDKSALSTVKNILSANGHTFIGYAGDSSNLLRYARTLQPDFIVAEPDSNFRDLKQSLEILDDELLAACVLLLDVRKNDILEYVRDAKVISCITKPVTGEGLLPVVDVLLSGLKKMREYEEKIRRLNDTLESRKVIDRAKWILVGQDGMSEAEAYEAINRKSRDNRITMRATAEAIILARGVK